MIQYRYKKGICVMEVNKMKKILLIMTMIMAFSFGNCFASQVQVSDEGAYNVYQKVINTMVAKGENRDIGNLVQRGKSENGLYDIWLFQTNGVVEMFWVNGAGYVSVVQIVTDSSYESKRNLASRMYLYTLSALNLTYNDVTNQLNHLNQVNMNMVISKPTWSYGANRYIHTIMFSGKNTFQYMVLASDDGNAR